MVYVRFAILVGRVREEAAQPDVGDGHLGRLRRRVGRGPMVVRDPAAVHSYGFRVVLHVASENRM